jgi:GNAT superfamily N-acetyltransferase
MRWLAVKDGQTAGRIMGIIHDEYNRLHDEKTARFFGLECIDDRETAGALLRTAEQWARNQGMERIIGPFGFSDKDPEGLQVEGFEHLPVIATATNAPYLEKLVTGEGYAKLTDCVVYRVPVPASTPENYFRIGERIKERSGIQVLGFSSRIKLRPFVMPVFRLINETYKDLLGFIPLTEKEMKKLADQYLPILDPRYVKLVLDAGQRPIAFVIAVPDFSEGLRQARGRLFPFGFLKVFASMKRTKQLDLLLGAVLPQWQGKGVTTLLAIELLKDVRSGGFTYMDSHLILETNRRMRAEVERIGGTVYKRYRIYCKGL